MNNKSLMTPELNKLHEEYVALGAALIEAQTRALSAGSADSNEIKDIQLRQQAKQQEIRDHVLGKVVPNAPITMSAAQLQEIIAKTANRVTDKILAILSDDPVFKMSRLAASAEALIEKEPEEGKDKLRKMLDALPEGAQTQWITTFVQARQYANDQDDLRPRAEEYAARTAWDSVKRTYKKVGEAWELRKKGEIEFDQAKNQWIVYNVHAKVIEPIGFPTEAAAQVFADVLTEAETPIVTYNPQDQTYLVNKEGWTEPVTAATADEAEKIVARALQSSGYDEADAITRANGLIEKLKVGGSSETLKEEQMGAGKGAINTSAATKQNTSSGTVTGIQSDEGAKSGDGKFPSVGGKVVVEPMAKKTLEAGKAGKEGLQSKEEGAASHKGPDALARGKGLVTEKPGKVYTAGAGSSSAKEMLKENMRLASLRAQADTKQVFPTGGTKDLVSGAPPSNEGAKSGQGKFPKVGGFTGMEPGVAKKALEPGKAGAEGLKGKEEGAASHKGPDALNRSKGLIVEKPAKKIWASAELEAKASATEVEAKDFMARREFLREVLATLDKRGVEATRAMWVTAASADAQNFISKEIAHLIKDKGYDQKRAEAAAYSVAREKGFHVPEK